MRQHSTTRIWVGRVFFTLFVGGVVALSPLLVVILVDDASFKLRHKDAKAVIISVRVDTRCSGAPVVTCVDEYYPTVRLTTDRGRIIEVETSDFRASDRSTIERGKSVTVHYDPRDPLDVRLSTGWSGQDWLTVGLMLLIYGGGGTLAVRHRRRSTGWHGRHGHI